MTPLRPQEIRRLVFLGALLVLSVVLIYRYTALRSGSVAPGPAPAEEPPPVLENAPPPPASPFTPGTVIFHGMLRDVEDSTPLEALDKDPIYLKLVDHVAGLDPRVLEDSSEGVLAYTTYLKHAPELRGRVFRVEGLAIVRAVPERLADPVRDREDVYRVFLFTAEDDAGAVCDLVDPIFIDKADRIQADGVFYKIVSFENRRGQTRKAPLLIARTAKPSVLPPTRTSGKLFVFKLVLVLGIVGVLLGAYFVIQRMTRVRYPSVLPRRGRPASGPPRG